MTVCIAAISDGKTVIGASDRMITSGGGIIEYEPNQPKIWPFTRFITLMVAGDIFIHTELYDSVLKVVNERILAKPEKWWKVNEVAELYSNAYLELKRKKAERDILKPLGLTWESWITNQSQFRPSVAELIQEQLQNYQTEYIQAIVTGLDKNHAGIFQPHIYVLNNAVFSCHDKVGFAAIGIGTHHAASHLMLSEHTIQKTETQTLLAVHQAKRKSEIAPGIGKGTDMIYVGNNGIVDLAEDLLDNLDKIYEKNFAKTREINKNSEEEVTKVLQDAVSKQNEQQKQEN